MHVVHVNLAEHVKESVGINKCPYASRAPPPGVVGYIPSAPPPPKKKLKHMVYMQTDFCVMLFFKMQLMFFY